MTETADAPKPNGDIATMSFEKALAELEAIVSKLESGGVPLEQSIAYYERGEALKKHCDRLLREAELKVERIQASEGTARSTASLDVE